MTFLQKVLAADEYPPDFVLWLTRFVDGTDYFYENDDARGYKPKFARFLEPFKPKKSHTLYRGLTVGGRGSVIEPWFAKLLGLKDVPKENQKVIHARPRPTSWTKSFKIAKDFATDHGMVLELKATPAMMLMDMEAMKKGFCLNDPNWEKMCEYTTEREMEITLLPGKYSATVKYISPNASLEKKGR